MRAVVLLALVMCAVTRAETEVTAAAGATEAAAETTATAAAAANVAAIAETQATATSEVATDAAAAVAAESEVEASAETSSASAEASAEAAAVAVAVAAAEKPKDDKAKADTSKSKKSFKPVMINRDSRRAVRSHHQNVRYTDGGRATILAFPAPPRRPDNRVEADVGSPLRRRFARWADAIATNKQQFFTPPYADEAQRQRYTSFVPSDAFFAPRRPTHFEPEYQDEHRLLSGETPFMTLYGNSPYPFFPYFAPQSGLPMPLPVPVPRQRYTEPEYNDEHAFAEWLEGAPEYAPEYAPVFDFDFAPLSAPFELEDALSYERAVYPNSPRARPSSWELYGLPEFPAMPSSVPASVAASSAAPFSGLDDPTGVRARSDFALGAAVSYPSGSGPMASLQKLDFALERLQNLNAQLKAAEAKIASSRLQQKQATDKLQRLNRIRANLQKLAAQIASLEAKVSADSAVQAEVASVVANTANTHSGKTVLASWLGNRIKFN